MMLDGNRLPHQRKSPPILLKNYFNDVMTICVFRIPMSPMCMAQKHQSSPRGGCALVNNFFCCVNEDVVHSVEGWCFVVEKYVVHHFA